MTKFKNNDCNLSLDRSDVLILQSMAPTGNIFSQVLRTRSNELAFVERFSPKDRSCSSWEKSGKSSSVESQLSGITIYLFIFFFGYLWLLSEP